MIQAEADMQVAGGRLVRTFFPNLQTNSSLAQGLLKNRTLLESRSFCLGAVCQPYTSKQKKDKKISVRTFFILGIREPFVVMS